MRSLPLSLRNIGAPGIIVIMLTVMLIFGGIGFLFLSSLSIDQKNFFEAFNQSVIENRERARNTAEFRDIQIQDIEESQNRTALLLPEFFRSLNDTAYVADILPQLINNTENTASKVDEIINLLNRTN